VSDVVNGNLSSKKRDEVINNFKSGKIKCLINVGVLVAGFNHPPIDLLVIARATLSTRIFAQQIGRLCRIHKGLKDGLLLDYGHNIETHGMIDDLKPRITKTTRIALSKEPPKARKCIQCNSYMKLFTRVCDECGYTFQEVEVMHSKVAYDGAMMSTDKQEETISIDHAKYYRHKKAGSNDSLRIEYHSGLRVYKEWICIEHKGYYGNKAKIDLAAIGGYARTIDKALEECSNYLVPLEIKIKKNGRYTNITNKIY
jgi:DNA repair protein RadD